MPTRRSSAARRSGAARGAVRLLGVWLALFALWMLFVDTLALPEVLAGSLSAAIAATFAEVVRRQGLIGFRPKPRWLLRIVRLPGLLVRDAGTVLLAAIRLLTGHRPAGRFRAVPFEPGDDAIEASTRRALVTAALSVAPNTFVVGVDRVRGFLVLHELVPGATVERVHRLIGPR